MSAIARVRASDLEELVPLMAAYCEFYEVAPGDASLRKLAQTLLDDPWNSGAQLLARSPTGEAIGFATLYWTFSTLAASAIGVMNDLYVAPGVRAQGVGHALIRACAAECAARGVRLLEWETAPSNVRAQRLYDRFDAERTTWVAYSLPITPR